MRVRTRRFGWLTLASKSRYSHPVVVAHGQRGLKRPVGRDPPPASGLSGGRTRDAIGDAPGAQLAIDRRSTLPLLELRGTQAVTNPLIEAFEDARRVGQTEVGLPSGEIAPQLRKHRLQASPAVPGAWPGRDSSSRPGRCWPPSASPLVPWPPRSCTPETCGSTAGPPRSSPR